MSPAQRAQAEAAEPGAHTAPHSIMRHFRYVGCSEYFNVLTLVSTLTHMFRTHVASLINSIGLKYALTRRLAGRRERLRPARIELLAGYAALSCAHMRASHRAQCGRVRA